MSGGRVQQTAPNQPTAWTKRPRSRRLPILIGSLVLLAASLGLYFAYASSIFRVGGINRVSTNLDEHSDGHDDAHKDNKAIEGENPLEAEQDAFTLHPEHHIFRKAKTIHTTWNVTREERAPDGVTKYVYLINGQFPGPTLEARSGDTLVVDVHNSIEGDEEDGIAVHWHGMLMKGSNEMDGVVGLTQCAIGPSKSFTYRFRIDDSQSGTFWYHAHAGVQRADGLFGGLIVHKPADTAQTKSDLEMHQYDTERLLLIGDWYHRQAGAVLDWYRDSDHYGMEPAPDSLLINGQGWFNCSMAVKARPVKCTTVDKPAVGFGVSRRVRLRVINTGISSGFTMSLSSGEMKLITSDGGHPVANDTPATKKVGVLYPGERMDLIAESSSEVDETRGEGAKSRKMDGVMTITLDKENMKLKNYALTKTQSFPIAWGIDRTKPQKRNHEQRHSATSHLAMSDVLGSPIEPMLAMGKPAEMAVLYTTMQIRASNGNQPVGIVNHTSWIIADPKSKPLLALDRENWGNVTKQPSSVQKLHVPWFRDSGEDKWIELVVNNLDDTGHPFHLHGYNFYVVARRMSSQYGGYNPFDPVAVERAGPMNTMNPLRKDTVYVPSMGYVVLRFPINNDGLWLFHCHVLWHQATGMGMVLQIGDVDQRAKHEASALCSR